MKLSVFYKNLVVPKLQKEFGMGSHLAVPRIEKVVVNMGIGDAKDNREEQEKIMRDLSQLVGQRPALRRSRKAISGFNLREGEPVGVKVTLRGKRMYDFLQKLFGIVLPRLRDFRGVSRSAFDGGGNYTLGITEHTVFPEIDASKVGKVRGLEVTIVTDTKDRQRAMRLLEELGMPFGKKD